MDIMLLDLQTGTKYTGTRRRGAGTRVPRIMQRAISRFYPVRCTSRRHGNIAKVRSVDSKGADCRVNVERPTLKSLLEEGA